MFQSISRTVKEAFANVSEINMAAGSQALTILKGWDTRLAKGESLADILEPEDSWN